MLCQFHHGPNTTIQYRLDRPYFPNKPRLKNLKKEDDFKDFKMDDDPKKMIDFGNL